MAGMVTNLFWGFLRAYVFQAVTMASATGMIADYSTTQLFTYSALTQAMLSVLLVFGWWELMLTIKSGDIVTDLCKPVNLYWFWQARDAGRCIHDFLLRGAPLFLLYAFFIPVVMPQTVLVWGVFALSLVMACLLSFSWRFVVNCIAFWTLDAKGFCSIAYTLGMVLMGFVIPVGWFPPWLQRVVLWTPFPAMLSTPVDIFLGRLSSFALGYALLRQALWLILMLTLAQFVLRQGVKRLVIQGG